MELITGTLLALLVMALMLATLLGGPFLLRLTCCQRVPCIGRWLRDAPAPGPGQVPAPPAVRNSLATRHYAQQQRTTEGGGASEADVADLCAICFIEFRLGDTVTVLPCGHFFCKSWWVEGAHAAFAGRSVLVGGCT